jgi:hypothetical protein
MSNRADPLKAEGKVIAEPVSIERFHTALTIDTHSPIHVGEKGQRFPQKALSFGVSPTTSPSRERWHLMLDEILNSDALECIEAITVNLEAYCSAARAFKALKAHPAERRKADRRRSDRPKVSSGM